MTRPSPEELAALHLDDASVDRAWDGALAEICAEGGDPDAMINRAADTLTQWRANPAPTHINPSCHCGATLRPRVEVFANADADEWVCIAGCTGGVFFDWTEAQFAECGLDAATMARCVL